MANTIKLSRALNLEEFIFSLENYFVFFSLPLEGELEQRLNFLFNLLQININYFFDFEILSKITLALLRNRSLPLPNHLRRSLILSEKNHYYKLIAFRDPKIKEWLAERKDISEMNFTPGPGPFTPSERRSSDSDEDLILIKGPYEFIQGPGPGPTLLTLVNEEDDSINSKSHMSENINSSDDLVLTRLIPGQGLEYSILPLDEDPEKNGKYLELLGEGTFGYVNKYSLGGPSSEKELAVFAETSGSSKREGSSSGRELAVKFWKSDPDDKMLNPDGNKENPTTVLIRLIKFSFLSEMAVTIRLNHPNVINFLSAGVSGITKHFYASMDLAQMSLINYFKLPDASRDLFQQKSLIYQLVCGLDYISSRFVMHRDLKPDNILLFPGHGNRFRLKISDFGAAKDIQCKEEKYVQNLTTIWYSPPEVLLGCNYTLESDKWSLACIIFEILLSGQVLFRGRDEFNTVDQIFSQIGAPGYEIFSSCKNWKDYSEGENTLGRAGRNVRPGLNSRRPLIELNPFSSAADYLKVLGGIHPDMINIISKLLNYDVNGRGTYKEILENPTFSLIKADTYSALEATISSRTNDKVSIIENKCKPHEDLTCLQNLRLRNFKATPALSQDLSSTHGSYIELVDLQFFLYDAFNEFVDWTVIFSAINLFMSLKNTKIKKDLEGRYQIFFEGPSSGKGKSSLENLMNINQITSFEKFQYSNLETVYSSPTFYDLLACFYIYDTFMNYHPLGWLTYLERIDHGLKQNPFLGDPGKIIWSLNEQQMKFVKTMDMKDIFYFSFSRTHLHCNNILSEIRFDLIKTNMYDFVSSLFPSVQEKYHHYLMTLSYIIFMSDFYFKENDELLARGCIHVMEKLYGEKVTILESSLIGPGPSPGELVVLTGLEERIYQYIMDIIFSKNEHEIKKRFRLT